VTRQITDNELTTALAAMSKYYPRILRRSGVRAAAASHTLVLYDC
jgi:hypothetical protein